jgi:hypothetical protein
VRRGWLVQRLGPDCSRIDLDELVHHEDIASLLYCMGQETANIHLGTPKSRKILRMAARAEGGVASPEKYRRAQHLPPNWLETAAHLMLKLSKKDWNRFRASGKAALR